VRPTYSVWLTREVDHEVVVVGSGFSGLAMAINLKKHGQHDFIVLEKSADLGGTWRDNRYPGCACDIPSHLYSYSFEPNPAWSRAYSPAGEIHDYLKRCASKYAVEDHLWFDSPLQVAEYDETSGVWTLTIGGPREHPAVIRCRALVLAVGALHEPAFPDAPGLGDFAGEVVHTAWWDPAMSLKGKRVGVVGTGASSTQLIPEIAPRAAELTVFQRTPPWILPKNDREFGRVTRRLFERLPSLHRAYRSSLYWRSEAQVLGFTSYPFFMKAAQRIALRHLRSQVADEGLLGLLTPDYTMGCKRILLADNYYPALQRDNVALETTPIDHVDATGVVTADGTRRDLDVLVLGTGFDVSGSYAFLDIFGKDGRNLGNEWTGEQMEAHLGAAVSGFPNLFTLLGPNTGLGHNSMLLMIEAQVDLIIEALKERDRRRARSVEVLTEVQEDFNRGLQRRSRGSVWLSGCHSWYLDKTGVNRVIWPGSTVSFRRQTRDFRPERYVFDGVRT
jgi:cation diffusion facilitator CzcD-associated flavoprotein CzcO